MARKKTENEWNTLLGVQDAEVDVVGEIVTWNPPVGGVSVAAIRQGLAAANLDASYAPDLPVRHAFTRACRELAEARVIALVDEDADTIAFQFTRQEKDTELERLRYDYEAMVLLDKKAGSISCKGAPHLAQAAADALDRAVAKRTGGDVGNIIRRVFSKEGDLFPVRQGGAVYLVLGRYSPLVDAVDAFVKAIGGSMQRYPIPAGNVRGQESVQDAVVAGLEKMIEEHKAAVAEFEADASPTTLERRAARVKETRLKVEAYKAYLGTHAETLTATLTAMDSVLRDKVKAAVARKKSAAEEKAAQKAAEKAAAATQEAGLDYDQDDNTVGDEDGADPVTGHTRESAAFDRQGERLLARETPDGRDVFLENADAEARRRSNAAMASWRASRAEADLADLDGDEDAVTTDRAAGVA